MKTADTTGAWSLTAKFAEFIPSAAVNRSRQFTSDADKSSAD